MKLRLAIFLILFFGFWAAALSIQRIAYQFSMLQPENYAAIARDAMGRGDFVRARQVLEQRISAVMYDFDAHYLLGEVLAAQQNYTDAVNTILSVLAKVPAARANPVRSIGYDEPKTYYLLARYLWLAGDFAQAGEMGRAALDAGHPLAQQETSTYLTGETQDRSAAEAIAKLATKLRAPAAFAQAIRSLCNQGECAAAARLLAEWFERAQKKPVAADTILRAALSLEPSNPSLALARVNWLRRHFGQSATSETRKLLQAIRETTGVQEIGTGAFQVTEGERISPEALYLGRNGRATAKMLTGVFRPKRLTFIGAGTWALGMYPIVILRCDGREITRLYLDDPIGRVYDLELWPRGARKQVELEFEFVNDAYEPYTRVDRNVRISDLFLY